MIFFSPTKVAVKCIHRTEPRYNEPRYNEIPVITNTSQKPKLKIYPDIMNVITRLKLNAKQINRDGNPVNSSLYATRGHYSDIFAALLSAEWCNVTLFNLDFGCFPTNSL